MPIVWVGAGLPSFRDRAPEAGATSFTERAEWSPLPFLTPSETTVAFETPARTAGRPYTDDALELLVGQSDGYPYLIQVLGRHAWDVSNGSATITVEHARTAITLANQQLDEGLYGLRWKKCAPRERAVLTAIAVLERDAGSSEVRISDIARLLNTTTTQLSPIRDRLIRKELIEPDQRGTLRLALPGMGASIIRTTNVATA